MYRAVADLLQILKSYSNKLCKGMVKQEKALGKAQGRVIVWQRFGYG